MKGGSENGNGRCAAIKSDGTRCAVTWGLSADGLCLSHDPERRAEAEAARRRGGEATRQKRASDPGPVTATDAPGAPTTLAEAKSWASWAIDAVVTGRLDPKLAQEAARLLHQFRLLAAEVDTAADVEELRREASELREAITELRRVG